MNNFKTHLLNEDKSLSGKTFSEVLSMILSKKAKIPQSESDKVLFASGQGPSESTISKLEKMGYNQYGEGYDSFWKKIYTPLEFAMMQSLAAGDSISESDKLYL